MTEKNMSRAQRMAASEAVAKDMFASLVKLIDAHHRQDEKEGVIALPWQDTYFFVPELGLGLRHDISTDTLKLQIPMSQGAEALRRGVNNAYMHFEIEGNTLKRSVVARPISEQGAMQIHAIPPNHFDPVELSAIKEMYKEATKDWFLDMQEIDAIGAYVIDASQPGVQLPANSVAKRQSRQP